MNTVTLLHLFLLEAVQSCVKMKADEFMSSTSTVSTTTTFTECPAEWIEYTNSFGMKNCFIRLDGFPFGACPTIMGCGNFNGGCQDAEMACESIGGMLASIVDDGENALVYSLSDPSGEAILTGMQDADPNYDLNTCIGLKLVDPFTAYDPASWKWSDDAPYMMPYVNWDTGWPFDEEDFACGALSSATTSPVAAAKWFSFPCNFAMRNAVCKRPAA